MAQTLNAKTMMDGHHCIGHQETMQQMWSRSNPDAITKLCVVQELIARNVNIECFDNDGWTPLYVAARYKAIDVVKVGAVTNMQSNHIFLGTHCQRCKH